MPEAAAAHRAEGSIAQRPLRCIDLHGCSPPLRHSQPFGEGLAETKKSTLGKGPGPGRCRRLPRQAWSVYGKAALFFFFFFGKLCISYMKTSRSVSVWFGLTWSQMCFLVITSS